MEPNSDAPITTPSAEAMLERLQAVDITQFDLTAATNQLKGNKQWISILTIPVSALLLVMITLIGTFVWDAPIASFLVAAGLIYVVARLFDQYEQQYRRQARQLVMQRIAATEGDYGLIPHFKHFLPTKYRHLWQSLRKRNYMYIDQYIQAVALLQKQLDPAKFTKIWHLHHPEVAPPEADEDF